VHQSFYAVLCDKEAHIQIDVSNKKVSVDSQFCLNILKNNKNFIYSLNVDLLKFFRIAQKYLDCIVFDKAYDLKYPFQEKLDLRDDFKDCYKHINSNELQASCSEVCSHLHLGRISPVFEGDYTFINDQVEYFDILINKIKDAQKMADSEDP